MRLLNSNEYTLRRNISDPQNWLNVEQKITYLLLIYKIELNQMVEYQNTYLTRRAPFITIVVRCADGYD